MEPLINQLPASVLRPLIVVLLTLIALYTGLQPSLGQQARSAPAGRHRKWLTVLLIAITSVIVMEKALALTIDYTKQRKAFGQPVFDFQNTQFVLAECKTEATVAKWLVKAGDQVGIDQPLCELETDKVAVEVNAKSAGTLGEILAPAGAEVKVGALLGRIAEGAGSGAPRPTAKPAPAAPIATPATAAKISVAPAPVFAIARWSRNSSMRRLRVGTSASTPRNSRWPITSNSQSLSQTTVAVRGPPSRSATHAAAALPGARSPSGIGAIGPAGPARRVARLLTAGSFERALRCRWHAPSSCRSGRRGRSRPRAQGDGKRMVLAARPKS